ncbi:amidohydrolase family protein [Lysinibacillus capsici]|uniref:amidohydrolase family protein n=1 Tax=Lysinibacillus capsici TaxID=2115968 RepID=UPI0036C88431
MKKRTIIDMHVHYVPELYRNALETNGLGKPDGMPYLPKWNKEHHFEFNEKMGISASILSISSPFVHFGNDKDAISLARSINEYSSELVSEYPDKFGYYATLPVPNVEGSINELHYAYDTLDADGVMLPSNSNGVYLGDKSFEPLMIELNNKKSVVLIHPTKPSVVPDNVLQGYPIPMLEFMFDTTRAVANLIFTNSFKRYPDIQWIIPHGGAALSILADRMQSIATNFGPNGNDPEPLNVLATLQNLHYDIAGFPFPRQIAALKELVPASKLMYGSDWPFTKPNVCEDHLQNVINSNTFTEAELDEILNNNTLRLFPRLGKYYSEVN